MGSPANEKGRTDDEGPQHKVTIAETVRSLEVRRDIRRLGRLRFGRRLPTRGRARDGWLGKGQTGRSSM